MQETIMSQVPGCHPKKGLQGCMLGGDIPAKAGYVPARQSQGSVMGGVTRLMVRQSLKWGAPQRECPGMFAQFAV